MSLLVPQYSLNPSFHRYSKYRVVQDGEGWRGQQPNAGSQILAFESPK